MKFSLFNSRKKLPLYETYNLSPVQTLCCAFFGVVTPRVIFTPFDSMRLLTDLHYKSGRRAIYKRVVENGIPSLWTGWICDIIRVPIQSGIRFLIFNHLKKYERKITSEKYHFFLEKMPFTIWKKALLSLIFSLISPMVTSICELCVTMD